MQSIQRGIIGLTSISRFYTSIAILTLILWVASFKYIQNSISDTNLLYQHPFKVSNASLKIKFNIQSMHQVMKGIKHTKSSEQIKVASLVDKYESDVLSEFTLISERYLGKKEVTDHIYQLITNWRTIRQNIFDLHLQRNNNIELKQAEQQSNEIVKALLHEIGTVIKFANNKAKGFTESSKSSLSNVDKIGLMLILFLLSMQLLLFRLFKRNSIKEKRNVLKALNWSNELLNSSPNAMIIADQRGKITQVNITAQKLFGYSQAEFTNLNISALMPKRFVNHQEKINNFFNHSSTRSMGEGKDLFAIKKSGEEFQVEISLNLAQLNKDRVAITSIRDVTKQKLTELKVLHQASYDFLTQLPNRFLSLDRLARSIERAKRNNNKFAVMYIDLDDFKKANDVFGHQMGDRILVSTAAKLTNVMRANDTVGRLGGDEFVTLIDDFSSKEALIKVANNILDIFKKPFSIGQQNILLSASIGISVYPDDGNTVEELLVNADLSMFKSKDVGKNSFTFFESSMKDSLNRHSAIEEALKGSLERNEFYLVYQPKYEISSNIIIGFEALLRWDNSEFRGINPDEFIPVLEQTGLINEVGMFVLDNALKSIEKWRSITQQPLQMAVNISPLQFNDPMLFQSIQQTLTKYNLPGNALEIEITEGILLEGTEELKKTLNDIREADIGIALDDFGTGYSSLSYIKDYPINSIKIDRSFIDEINKNETQAILVNAMISLAHSLNFHVTAEGIECKAQLEYLKNIKCDIAQGYYLSQPITAEKIIPLL